MSFIRIKRRRYKDKEYCFAYLVENKWNKKTKSAKQKVKKYIGKVVEIDSVRTVESLNKKKDFKSSVYDIIEHQLLLCGFKKSSDDVLVKDDIGINLLKNKVYSLKTKKNLVIKMNEGFLCKETINRLLRFKISREYETRIEGERLATLIINAGLKISKDVFIQLFKICTK